jgi:hypothetical protein
MLFIIMVCLTVGLAYHYLKYRPVLHGVYKGILKRLQVICLAVGHP